MNPPLTFQLTPEQELGVNLIQDWYIKSKQDSSLNALKAGTEFRLGGYAGTGKTTMIREVMKTLKGAINVCAFTGKAAYVLRRKGIQASTIHGLIYKPEEVPGTTQVKFVLREPHDLQTELIIVDEASMVSHELYHHLKSFNKPLLFVGDPGQLEPVGDNPNLMKNVDFTLKQIQRQALDSPIIGLATAIREGGSSYDPRKFGSKGDALVFQSKVLKADLMHSVDQIITAKNDTRRAVNAKFRRDKGFGNFDGLHDGEKLIVLKNDSELGVFNGQVLFVEEIRDERPLFYEALVRFDGSEHKQVLPIWSEPFYRELNESDRPPRGVAKCDFGYCITCHKSQGSEWDHIIVVDEWMGRTWDMARWRYTAVTRAAKKLNYAM